MSGLRSSQQLPLPQHTDCLNLTWTARDQVVVFGVVFFCQVVFFFNGGQNKVAIWGDKPPNGLSTLQACQASQRNHQYAAHAGNMHCVPNLPREVLIAVWVHGYTCMPCKMPCHRETKSSSQLNGQQPTPQSRKPKPVAIVGTSWQPATWVTHRWPLGRILRQIENAARAIMWFCLPPRLPLGRVCDDIVSLQIRQQISPVARSRLHRV